MALTFLWHDAAGFCPSPKVGVGQAGVQFNQFDKSAVHLTAEVAIAETFAPSPLYVS